MFDSINICLRHGRQYNRGINDSEMYIQVWLFGGEEGEKEFLGLGIIGPGTVGFAKNLRPIIRRQGITVVVKTRRRFPNIPTAFRGITG